MVLRLLSSDQDEVEVDDYILVEWPNGLGLLRLDGVTILVVEKVP